MEKTVKFKIKADGERVLVTAGCCVYALTQKETENLMLRIRDLLNKMGSEIEEVYMAGKFVSDVAGKEGFLVSREDLYNAYIALKKCLITCKRKIMRKEEVKVLALQDQLKEAKKEWDKTLDDIMAGKGNGVFGNEYDKAEKEAREKVERIKKRLKEAIGERDAYTDEEIDAIVGVTKPEELSPEEDAFLDNLADTFVQ